MERKTYLEHYRLFLDQVGLPAVIRRSAREATFRAEDSRTGDHVAVQVIPMTALRSAARDDLEREAQAAREFEHVNIPTLRDFGFDDGYLIYVTDYFAGTSAAEWIRTKGPMPVGVVLRLALQLVNATSAATFHGLEHRAINPHNIIIVPEQTAEGEGPLIKLVNLLGVAPDLTSARDPESPDPFNFLSPEQVQTGATDFRSQLYSLGATLWFLLTGAAPAGGVATVENTTRLPAVVRNLFAQLLASDPEQRPLDPLGLQAQIHDCLAQLERRDAVASKLGLPLATEVTAPKQPPPRSHWGRPLALAAVLLGLAALAAVVMAGRFRPRGEIGVPVGVPEKVAARSASVPPIPTPPAIPAPSQPTATESPVLTSNTDVATEEQTAATDSDTSDRVAEATATPADSAAVPQPNESSGGEPTIVAAGDSTPPSVIVATTPPAETAAVTQAAPTIEPTSTPIVRASETPVTMAKSERAKPAAAAPKKSEVAKAVERETPLPPRPREAVQFLGVTPQGELVYGSSSEKMLAAPPATREETPRRKARAHPTPASIYGLPVLPALPPDE